MAIRARKTFNLVLDLISETDKLLDGGGGVSILQMLGPVRYQCGAMILTFFAITFRRLAMPFSECSYKILLY